mgnify:CR=1 FL=1
MGKRKLSNHTKKAPTQAAIPAPQMDAPISNSELIELCIHSNVNVDEGAFFDDGHAWLTLHQNGNTDGYGLWPDRGDMDNPFSGLLPDPHSDVKHNHSHDSSRSPLNYCESITEAQAETFNALRQAPAFWSPTNNCSSWASSIFAEVTGTDVDADDEWLLGVETPRELGQNITRMNEQRTDNGVQ